MGLICTNLANYGAPPCMYIYMYIYIYVYIYISFGKDPHLVHPSK